MDKFEKIFKSHQEAFEASTTPEQTESLENIAKVLLHALKNGKKILLCGNGGSASDSQHIAAELIARFKKDRRSLPALALTTDSSIITAVANDYDYNQIFARQIEGLGDEGDVLIAISTSGNSQNVIEAVQAAKEKNLTTVGLTGGNGGMLQEVTDCSFCAGSDITSHIQEIHIMVLHALCEVIENTFFGE